MPLNRVFPGADYEDDEVGRKDHFDHLFATDSTAAWYVGKAYEDGSTEIMSMGLEQIHEDPVGFARRDPEYCKFIIAAMRGELPAFDEDWS